MTTQTEKLCHRCGDEADGLDDIHCQTCWEYYTSQAWWEMVKALEPKDQSDEQH